MPCKRCHCLSPGKGVRNLLCEAPGGPFRQEVPDPFPLLVLFAAAAAGFFAARAAEAQSLESLPRLCDFEMRRITSTDPKGGNRDFRELPPGGTLVLAEVERSRLHRPLPRQHHQPRAAPPANARPADVLGRRDHAQRGSAGGRLLRRGLRLHREVQLGA